MRIRRWDLHGGVFLRIGRRWIGLVAQWPFVCLIPVIAGGTDAQSTADAYITIGNGASPEVYSLEITEVTSIGGPNETSEELQATHLRSPGRRHEYIQSYLDTEDLPLEMNVVSGDASQLQLRSDYLAGTTRSYRLNYPDGSTDTFDAFVKGVSRNFAVGEVLRFTVTLRVSGDVVHAE